MKTNPLKEGSRTGNSAGIEAEARRMARERAVELAAINGRASQEDSKADWEQAQSELTTDSDTGSKEAVIEATPESAHGDPVPGLTGNKVPVAPGEDEDDEGMAGAEHDQRRQSTSE